MALRPDWITYHLGLAKAAAQRADCRRAQHGAVVVRSDNTIAGTGYNAHWPGGPSCLKGECPRGLLSREMCPSLSSYDTGDPDHRCESLHAESNALANTGSATQGTPCTSPASLAPAVFAPPELTGSRASCGPRATPIQK